MNLELKPSIKQPAERSAELSGDSVAVFIDVENIYYSILNTQHGKPDWAKLVEICRQYGRCPVIRAFVDWTEEQFAHEGHIVRKSGIVPVMTARSLHGKSSVDAYLIVEAMEYVLLNKGIGTVVIVSGDRDLVPLIQKLRSMNLRVVLIAGSNSMSAEIKAVVEPEDVIEFDYVREPLETGHELSDGKSLALVEAKKHIISLVRGLQGGENNEGWVNLAVIGIEIKKGLPDFRHQAYGFDKLVDLIKRIPEVEIRYDTEGREIPMALACVPGGEDRKETTHGEGGQPVQDDEGEVTFTGKIVNLKDNSYGFIALDDEFMSVLFTQRPPSNIFFHKNEVIGNYYDLLVGDRVIFTADQTEQGYSALNVEKKF